MAGMSAQQRCKIDMYGWGRDALTFCRMSLDEFNSLETKIGWGAAFEVLLLAIARKCGDEVEECEKGWSVGYSIAEETLVVLDFVAVILQ